MAQKLYPLRVGAGRGVIHFPQEIFPTWEGYNAIHDDPCVRVLLLESEAARYAVMTLELVSVWQDEMERIRQTAGQTLNIPPEQVWFCVTHSLSTPHLWTQEKASCQADWDKDALMRSAIERAAEQAITGALQTLRPAQVGFGMGQCAINVHRNVLTKDGWWLGSGEGGPVDRSVPVLRFADENENTIAVLFGYNCQPAVMDGSFTRDGGRLVSGDLAGASCRFVEQQLGGGAVAMYCIGAGGDEWPALKAKRVVVGTGGDYEEIDLHEDGFVLLELLGERLGQVVVQTAEAVCCGPMRGALRLDRRTFTYPGQKIPRMEDIHPAKQYDYVPDGEKQTPVEALQIGDTVLLGVQPEICTQTEMALRERSPFAHTITITFVNGGAKYMAPAEFYDRITFQSMNSRFARGSAERFEENAIEFLQELKAREPDREGG